MESHSNGMTDTGPLVKLKKAMQVLKDEIAQFEVRTGVVEHTLMQAKIRTKKPQLSII